MIIELKAWQKNLVQELLDALPASARNPLESSVRRMAYIEKQTGDGFYRDHIVYISRGIRHPRLMAERTCHEWGHGIDEWLTQNGYRVTPYSPERIADAFALSVLYPEILDAKPWRDARKVLADAFYPDGFPDVGTERLIDKYAAVVMELTDKSGETLGIEVHRSLNAFFNAQSAGFLRNHYRN